MTMGELVHAIELAKESGATDESRVRVNGYVNMKETKQGGSELGINGQANTASYLIKVKRNGLVLGDSFWIHFTCEETQ